MPSETNIRQWLARLVPVQLSDLPNNERDCSVCREPYTPPQQTANYPVRVRAEHPDSRCTHIFCRDCIERYFHTTESYYVRCPLCRALWFENYDENGRGNAWGWDLRVNINLLISNANANHNRGSIPTTAPNTLEEQNDQAQEPAWIRLTPESEAGLVSDFEFEESTLNSGEETQQLSNRGTIHASIALLQYILREFPVGEEDERLSQRVQNAERAVRLLWEMVTGSG